MKVNFYLDKPYNPDISPEKVKQELAKVGGKKKNLAQKFWNPSPTALSPFLSPDKSCRIKYRTNYKILPKSWDFEKERLKPVVIKKKISNKKAISAVELELISGTVLFPFAIVVTVFY